MLDLAPHADVLALVGAARTRANPAPRSIVLDFGYSSVKRGHRAFSRRRAATAWKFYTGPRVTTWAGSQPTPDDVVHAVVGVIRATFRRPRTMTASR